MTSPLYERVCQIVAATFSVPMSSVSAETSPDTVAAWDSMGHLSLVLTLEQELDVDIPPHAVEKMKDVAAIVSALDDICGERPRMPR